MSFRALTAASPALGPPPGRNRLHAPMARFGARRRSRSGSTGTRRMPTQTDGPQSRSCRPGANRRRDPENGAGDRGEHPRAGVPRGRPETEPQYACAFRPHGRHRGAAEAERGARGGDGCRGRRRGCQRRGGAGRSGIRHDRAGGGVAQVETIQDVQTLTAGAVAATAHRTPGHTPGGTSRTWRSRENGRRLDMAYADSFQFGGRQYDLAAADFERTTCDILITPQPEDLRLWERLEKRKTNWDARIDGGAFRALAASAREQFRKRLGAESGQKSGAPRYTVRPTMPASRSKRRIALLQLAPGAAGLPDAGRDAGGEDRETF